MYQCEDTLCQYLRSIKTRLMSLIFTPLFLFLLPLHLWFQPFSSIAASCLEWCFSRPSWKFLFFLTLELSRTQNKVLQKYLKICSWDLTTDIFRRRKKYDVLITNICYWYIAHAFDVHAKCTKVHGLRFFCFVGYLPRTSNYI